MSLHSPPVSFFEYWVQTNHKQEQTLNANWSHIPFPDDGHRFRRVAREDHVVALRQDEPLGADVHPVVHRGLRLAKVDPGQVMELDVGNYPILQVVVSASEDHLHWYTPASSSSARINVRVLPCNKVLRY